MNAGKSSTLLQASHNYQELDVAMAILTWPVASGHAEYIPHTDLSVGVLTVLVRRPW